MKATIFGNGGAAIAYATDRFAPADAERRELLDRLCRERPIREVPEECDLGHPMDGVRMRHGRPEPYCRRCNARRVQARRNLEKRAPGQTHCACGRELAANNHSGRCSPCRWGSRG